MDLDQAIAGYESRFGESPVWAATAPGRVNLIGEHTDYNEGFVFPMAIPYGVAVAAGPGHGKTELSSRERGTGKPIAAAHVRPHRMGWSAYIAGTVWSLRRAGHRDAGDLRLCVASDLPIGAGVSSSAALEVATGVLWNEAFGLGLDNRQIALLAQAAENDFVGVACGVMDQMASALGVEGAALLLDTQSLEVTPVPVPPEWAVVLCDTGTSRGLAASAYNERRAQCETAARLLGIRSLREATLAQLTVARDRLEPVVYHRALHVVTENQRCRDFVHALQERDARRAGDLMRQSHESLRNYYEVSSVELDVMAHAASTAAGGIGARMTGAGFGGACVALVERDRVGDFVVEAEGAYRARTEGRTPRFLVCEPSAGAQSWGLNRPPID